MKEKVSGKMSSHVKVLSNVANSYVVSPNIELRDLYELYTVKDSEADILRKQEEACSQIKRRLQDLQEEMSELFRDVQYVTCLRLALMQTGDLSSYHSGFNLKTLNLQSDSLEEAYRILFLKNEN